MKKQKVFSGFYMRVILHINRTRGSFCVALLTVSLSLFTLTFVLALLFNFYKVTSEISKNTIALGFLSVESEEQARQIENKLKEFSLQIKTELIFPEQAFLVAKKNMGPSFNGFLEETSISMPWVLKIESTTNNIETNAFILAELKSFPEVSEISIPGEEIQRAKWTVRFFYAAGILITSLLSILVIVIVMNAIRLSVLKHLAEIRVMRLVGATEFFVRTPYIIEGFLLGFLGALFSFILMWVFHILVRHSIDDVIFHDLNLLGFYDISLWIFASIFLFGCVLGILGSFLIMLKNFENDLVL